MKLSKLVLCMLMSRQLVMFSIVHFNDFYNVQNASFFLARLKEEKEAFIKKHGNDNNMKESFQIAFSGDFVFPSVESEVAKGLQFKMFLDKLGELGPTTAVVGNHEFDFGFDHFNDKIKNLSKNFLWLASNIYEKGDNSKKPIGNLGSTNVVTLENNLKLCYLGLIDDESFTSAKLPKNKYEMTNYLVKAKELSNALKKEGKCDVIIALTHMTTESDIALLADKENAINFVLGGHTHDYIFKFTTDKSRFVLKSGFDFENFSVLESEETKCNPSDYKEPSADEFKNKEITFTFCIPFTPKEGEAVKHLRITLKKINVEIDKNFIANFNQKVSETNAVSENHEISLKDYLDKVASPKFKEDLKNLTSEKKLDFELCINTFDHILNVPKYYKSLPSLYIIENSLDVSLAALSTKENPLGNLITDIIRAKFDTDIAVIKGNVISNNKTYKANTLLNMLDMKRHFAERSILNKADITADDVDNIVDDEFIHNRVDPQKFLQISGLIIRSGSLKNKDDETEGNINRLKALHIKLNRHKLKDQNKFSLATLKNMADTKQGYPSFTKIKLEKTYENRNLFDLMEQFSQYGRTLTYCIELVKFKNKFQKLSLDMLIYISKQASTIDKTKTDCSPTEEELNKFKSTFEIPNTWICKKPELLGDKGFEIPISFMIHLDKETLFKMKAFTLVESTCYYDDKHGDKVWAFKWNPKTSGRLVFLPEAYSKMNEEKPDSQFIQNLSGTPPSKKMIL